MPGLFLCNRKFLGISCYIKGTDVPKMRIRAKMQTVVSDRVRRENVPGIFFFRKKSVQYRNAKTDRKEEKLCFAESEKMIHAGVEAGSHIVSAI